MRVLKSMKGITHIEELPPSRSLESREMPIEFKEINLPVISCQFVEEKKMATAPQNKTACKDEEKSCKTLLQVPSQGQRMAHCHPSSASEGLSDDSSSSEIRRKRRSAVCSAASISEMEEERRFLRVLHKMF